MRWLKLFLVMLLAAAVVVMAWSYLSHTSIAMFDPQGTIARQERNLIIVTALLSLVVVVPVFVMLAVISWKYREGNTKTKYQPDWDHSRWIEAIWWGVPTALIVIISVINWDSSHALDPSKALAASTPPLTVEVVALNWKWLFIYPQQHIATVNYLEIPDDTPINFDITADAPMNSFWIPQLGGQIYAMPGMSTQLHLMADGIGTYQGSSANISGTGFASMRFAAHSVSPTDFKDWAAKAAKSDSQLDYQQYLQLAKDSQNNPTATYQLKDPTLYGQIVSRNMAPSEDMPNMPGMVLP